ncbi:MAG: TonB-dependent receptor [Prevotella sp.]|nr:TonB-dependent receptor [Prevotella sp.]
MAQVTTSSINGKVVADGEEVIGATVTAKHVPSGTVYNAVTNINGRYTIQGMRVGGPYEITISYLGFRTEEIKNVQLALGEASTFNVTMQEDSKVLGEIVVTGKHTIGGSGASTNFSLQQIENAPTVNRNIYDIAKLSPLVNVSKYGGISIAGTNNRYNSFQIDGVVSNDVFGLSSDGTNGSQAGGNPISMDAIEQVQVVASPFDVRQSGFTGGAINAITKSGTNKFTGTAFGYYTNEDMYSRWNQMTGKEDKLTDQAVKTYGFTIGGPIIKDKLFFFGSVERKERSYPASYYAGMDGYFMTTELAAAIAKRYYEITGIQESWDRPDNETKSTSIMARLDWNISNKTKLTLRYQHNRGDKDNASSGNYSFYFSNSLHKVSNRTNSFVAELTSHLSDQYYNELRVSGNFVRDHRDVPYQGPTLYITNGEKDYDVTTNTFTQSGTNSVNIGTGYQAGINFVEQDIWTVEDNLSIYKGNHTITVGTHNEFYNMKNGFFTYANGQWNYTGGFTSLFNDTPNLWQWNHADEAITGTREWGAPMKAGQLGFYIQDKWDINTNLQLTLGLRVDAPVYFNSPSWNSEFNLSEYGIQNDVLVGRRPKTSLMFSPRLGFRFFMDDDHKYQLRGGVGIFNGRAPFVWIENAWANTGIEKKGTTIRVNVPTFGQYGGKTPAETAASAAGTSSKPDINTVDRDFKFPQVVRANLALESLLPGDVKMTLEGMFSKNLNNVWFENLAIKDNGVTVFAAPGFANSAIPYYSFDTGGYNSVVNMTNTNKGYSYQLTARIEKSFDFGLSLMANYTFGHSFALNEGGASQALSNWQQYLCKDPNKQELAYSTFDVPHRFMAQIGYDSKRYGRGLFQTHVSLTYNGVSGMRYSLTMDTGSSPSYNGDSRSGNTLLYIPTDAELEAMNFSSKADKAKFKDWIENDEYASEHRGEFAERNSNLAPWENQFDLHIAQDFFYLKNRGSKISLVFDILNVANLLNHDWGTSYSSTTACQILKVDNVKDDKAGNKYGVFSFAGQGMQINNIASRWHMQLGLRVTF